LGRISILQLISRNIAYAGHHRTCVLDRYLVVLLDNLCWISLLDDCLGDIHSERTVVAKNDRVRGPGRVSMEMICRVSYVVDREMLSVNDVPLVDQEKALVCQIVGKEGSSRYVSDNDRARLLVASGAPQEGTIRRLCVLTSTDRGRFRFSRKVVGHNSGIDCSKHPWPLTDAAVSHTYTEAVAAAVEPQPL
jgi:hypothetical protein